MIAHDLARRSDINLTLAHYSHTVVENQAEALAALPDLDALPAEAMRATGTNDAETFPVIPMQGLPTCLPKRMRKTRLPPTQ